jgi:hypothetical protein
VLLRPSHTNGPQAAPFSLDDDEAEELDFRRLDDPTLNISRGFEATSTNRPQSRSAPHIKGAIDEHRSRLVTKIETAAVICANRVRLISLFCLILVDTCRGKALMESHEKCVRTSGSIKMVICRHHILYVTQFQSWLSLRILVTRSTLFPDIPRRSPPAPVPANPATAPWTSLPDLQHRQAV